MLDKTIIYMCIFNLKQKYIQPLKKIRRFFQIGSLTYLIVVHEMFQLASCSIKNNYGFIINT